jgi:hypothetical protein
MKQAASALEITYRQINDLKPYTRNARTHSKRQIRQIADSINAFGFTNPVLLKTDSTIIAGHGRVEAARLLGMNDVPTIQLSNLSEDEVRAYILADNKLADNAGWDESILKIELQHLLTVDLGFEVSVTGFEIPEIDLILQRAEAKPDPDDAIEAPLGPAISRPGDRWLLGKHRIYCGNSLDEQSYQELMEGRKADAIFVDPPYNVAIDGHVSGNGSIHHREFAMASGEMTEKEFVEFLSASFGFLIRHSKPGSVHFACMDWRHVGEILSAGKRAYDALLNLCIWAKDKGGMGSFYRSQHELIFVFRNGNDCRRLPGRVCAMTADHLVIEIYCHERFLVTKKTLFSKFHRPTTLRLLFQIIFFAMERPGNASMHQRWLRVWSPMGNDCPYKLVQTSPNELEGVIALIYASLLASC